jgi:pre-mRNA branch site protein p14
MAERRTDADSTVLYHQPSKAQSSAAAKAEIRARESELASEKIRLGMTD